MRKIIHCDADCFYVAVEERDDPSLRGRPVAVGGDESRRGVIATCNYEARAYGVHSAMPTAIARRLCPDLILVPGNMTKYRAVSAQMSAVFSRFTSMVEPLSLDEAFLDVSESPLYNGSATYMAEAIRQQVAREIGITVSAGVGPNKFLAKVASDWLKPDGLFTIPPAHVADFVQALSVSRIPGVGPVTLDKLQRLGIETCGQLQNHPYNELYQHFGAMAERLYGFARGNDERLVTPERTRKSMSVEHTYVFDLPDRETAKARLPVLYEKLLKRLQEIGSEYRIQSPFIKLKFCDFSATTLERGSLLPSLPVFGALLDMAYQRGQKPVRLIGIGVNLEEPSGQLALI
jgi:DNA polymerase-4